METYGKKVKAAFRARKKVNMSSMISNDRSTPYSPKPGFSQGNRPAQAEDMLKTDFIKVERKTFVFSLKENPRGRFLRITEDVLGRRDSIIVPVSGLKAFKQVIESMIELSEKIPSKVPPVPESQQNTPAQPQGI